MRHITDRTSTLISLNSYQRNCSIDILFGYLKTRYIYYLFFLGVDKQLTDFLLGTAHVLVQYLTTASSTQ